MRWRWLIPAALLLASPACAAPDTGAPAGAEPLPIVALRDERDTRESICLLVESAARSHDLPLEFFARVIWQESRFQPAAIGPMTRSGARAQGIAQFMPGTASERALLDPFDPVQALPKSAEFLSELRGRFGNLGLAAAAYNAGPRRVQDWLDGRAPHNAGRNAQLRRGDHRRDGGDVGGRGEGGEGRRARIAADYLPGADGAAAAIAQCLRVAA